MNLFVIDASAALAWLMPSQATPQALAFLNTTRGERYVAPSIFDWEVWNVLAFRARRGPSPGSIVQDLAVELDSYRIVRREPVSAQDTVAFALAAELSLFDAAYLSLAVELDAELATRDAVLAQAARRHGVPTHDLRDDR